MTFMILNKSHCKSENKASESDRTEQNTHTVGHSHQRYTLFAMRPQVFFALIRNSNNSTISFDLASKVKIKRFVSDQRFYFLCTRAASYSTACHNASTDQSQFCLAAKQFEKNREVRIHGVKIRNTKPRVFLKAEDAFKEQALETTTKVSICNTNQEFAGRIGITEASENDIARTSGKSGVCKKETTKSRNHMSLDDKSNLVKENLDALETGSDDGKSYAGVCKNKVAVFANQKSLDEKSYLTTQDESDESVVHAASLLEQFKIESVVTEDNEKVFDASSGSDDEDKDSIDPMKAYAPTVALQSIRLSERMKQKVQLLTDAGAKAQDMNVLVKRRAFVSVQFDKLTEVVAVLVKFFGSGDVACKVLSQNSGILSKPVDQLESKLKCFQEFNLKAETCLRIGTVSHCLLTMTAESLRSKLSYLQEIGLDARSQNVLLSRFPQALRLSIEGSMEPTVLYLQSKGMSREDVTKFIIQHPSVLAMSVDNNLNKKFELLSELGLSSEECQKAIGFLTLPSCERVRSIVDALKKMGLSDADVLEMIRKNPDIFSRSPENLTKKIKWLLNEGNRTVAEIVHYPTCLCFHLDNRIIPRINALRENGKLNSIALSSILAVSEATFRQQFDLPNFPPSKKSYQPRRQ